MKNIIVTTFTLLVIGMFLTINPAFAGDRIEFKMTAEEIAAEDTENAKQAAFKEAAKNNSRQRFKVYEMAESGQTVSFPMTAEEIAAEDAENDRLAAIRKAKPEEHKKQVVIFELAESGVSIEFPVKTSGKVLHEAAAEKKSPDDSKM
jgi:hypothetical protein